MVSENMLRGDKGVRMESAVSNGTYFGRAMGMAKGEVSEDEERRTTAQ